MTVTSPKPVIVFFCPPEPGHTNPLIPHATYLTSRGHEVHFIAGPASENAIKKAGAAFHAIHSLWKPEMFDVMHSFPDEPSRFMYGMKHNFIDLTERGMKALSTVLEDIHENYGPERSVVVVQEYAALGAWPFILGSPLPKGYERFPRLITFSTIPLPVSSVDTAPFGPGLPPDSSEGGRSRSRAMYEATKGFGIEMAEYANAIYEKLGVEKIPASISPIDFWATAGDVTVQPCSASLEYPRSDLSPKVRYIGGLPRKDIDSNADLPNWWDEMLAAKQAGRKIIFVSQGTFKVDYTELLIPTLKALADHDQCMVIGTLGIRGAQLGESVQMPVNAQIVDFLLYDAILAHADVFVSNAGYGGFMHSVMNGVPMVLAGTGQDKAEVAMRGEWAGIAVNLRTSTPTVEALRKAVDKVLSDSRFKTRCMEIRRENEELNCLAQLEKLINGDI
ncbi:UDP-Glycosyltransferase/glycogen phosphorylase [Aspergillus desertorum]